ncbi:MAG: hypothetical protein OEV30_12145 [Ignavibacteria bacterium]|nr:hypothetical protein [Ignavibacteria bacterium]
MLGSRPILRYALLGGAISGATIGLPVLGFLNCACCAGVMLGGFLAVFFAVKDLGDEAYQVSRTDALQLGVFSGLAGAVIGTILYGLVMLVAGDVVHEILLSILREGDIRSALPPEFLEAFDDAMEGQGDFSLIDLIGHLFIWLFLAPLFGLVGGLIGYSLLRNKMNEPPPSLSSPSEMTP